MHKLYQIVIEIVNLKLLIVVFFNIIVQILSILPLSAQYEKGHKCFNEKGTSVFRRMTNYDILIPSVLSPESVFTYMYFRRAPGRLICDKSTLTGLSKVSIALQRLLKV